MAMPRKIKVTCDDVFPYGVYAVSAVTQVKDFDRSTKEKPVYSIDEETGLSIWSVDVMDGDIDARKADKTVSVKILAKVQPVLPPMAPGQPFTAVVFEGMTATPYVAENNGRPRLAWSFRATEVRAPRNAASNKSAAA
ncbi:hypothetical protein GCM10029976_078340 [Kribbella albertanoniae]|uniref:Plasmid replication, integration and excision activator n=1 Tax=Kribbella albertanoniae TaxID=1266829 RepID=A0A4R4PMC4_9ACTN|nr:plasmid replication, integration and excision activator [Kribbella albertanoniae]TDC23189.1 plasmid replication, integration and excision activator [Kribbella albertanoniae]